MEVVTARLWEFFAAKAGALGTEVRRATDAASTAAVLNAVREAQAGATGQLVRRFPAVAAACGATATALSERSQVRAAAAACGGAATAPLEGSRASAVEVVTAGLFAVAETGSVALAEERADRGACFLAERLWVLVPMVEILPTLDAALERLAALIRSGARYATLMSGPSRTADIERTLTIGVHGPRALVVVVLDSLELDDRRFGNGQGA